MTRRWVWRGVTALGVFATLQVLLTEARFAPEPVRLALLVLLAVAVSGLVRDSLDAHTGAPDWSTPVPRATVPAGGDARLAAYVRLVEAHLSARTPDPELRERLAALCDQRLERRHGLDRRDPAARDAVRGLLGDRMLADLVGPPRRLRPDEVDEHLRRIEAL
jgi:hypothetical protein